MALAPFLIVPATAQTTLTADLLADLLLKDEILQAETLINNQPRTALTVAFRGEIEFRRGHFDQAETLYREALKMDPKTGRAHFGLGKLAMAKVQAKQGIQSLHRAIELDAKEPIYRLYASEASGVDKDYAQQRKQLEEYLRLNPRDEDRVAEAKAGLEILKAFESQDIGEVEAPANPAPIRFRKSLNLIFTSVMINGKGPYDFAIDTGATQTVISEKLAAEIGLPLITSTVVYGIGGSGKVETKLYKARELVIGDLKVRNTPLGTFNDPLISSFADGILGTSAFSDFVMDIDYPAASCSYSASGRQRRPAPKYFPFGFSAICCCFRWRSTESAATSLSIPAP